jgi:hypothetical protein
MVVAKPGNVNATSSKSLIDVSKDLKSTKLMNTTGKPPKNANDANVKKNWLMVKSRLSPDVMPNKLAKNSLKFHQLVSLNDTQLTKKCHNALSSETSHGNVVPEESGLVTNKLKVVKTLASFHHNAHHAKLFKLQNVDQIMK